MILTKSGAKEHLRNLKPFSNTYSDIENQLKNQQAQITDQYNATISGLESAYRENASLLSSQYGADRYALGLEFSQNMSDIIANAARSRSNLLSASGTIGQGFLKQNSSDLEKAMNEAYNVYSYNLASSINNLNQNLELNRSNLANDLTSGLEAAKQNAISSSANLSNTAQQQANQLDKLLESEAENYSNLYNAPREYLEYLIKNYDVDYTSPEFGKFFDITYQSGSPTGALRSDKWFESNFYDRDETGNVTGLSNAGKDFYRQILYGTSDIAGVPSFEKWLRENNYDLWEWSASQSYDDKYDRNIEAVFGGAGVDINNHNYRYGVDGQFDIYKSGRTAETTYTDNQFFGNVQRWNSDNGATLNYFENIKLNNLNVQNFANDKSESFTATYGGSEYKMKVKKDAAIADDDTLNDIVDNVGTIKNNKLYTYSKNGVNKLYLSNVDEEGNIKLKEVTITSNSDDFWKRLDDIDLSKSWAAVNAERTTKMNAEKPIGVQKREGTYKKQTSRQSLTGTKSGKW